MRFLVEIVLVASVFGALVNAVYVDAPERITLLPGSSQLVFYTIFRTEIFAADNTSAFDGENACLDHRIGSLEAALLQSGRNFHSCYSLTDAHVARFMNVSNETQLLQMFQRDVDRCPESRTHFYEFNCYVGVVQTYLQKIDSYVHWPNNYFEYSIYYQLALGKYRKLAICTGGELRALMERVGELTDAQC